MSAILKTKPLHVFSAGREVSANTGSDGDVSLLTAESLPVALVGDRLVAFQALQLLMRLDRELLEARAQWNQDWFRRLMRIRPKAVRRVTRRWVKLDPTTAIPLGSLRRRYHANLAGYLYECQINGLSAGC